MKRASMKTVRLAHLVLASLTAANGQETKIAEWIEQLPKTEELGVGYSAMFAGSQFLPRKDSSQWSTSVIGAPRPEESETLTMIVSKGAKAIPLLVKHLDDKRPTRIKPVSGMMWIGWNDEYDFNSRTRADPPHGVNRDSFDEKNQHPNKHQITVGDLCFVALGQIVNRTFSATRYQPSGGLIVNSPTYSEVLLNVARKDYGGMTQNDHLEQLIEDFNRPDHESRRNGAVMRLAFYYPDVLNDLVKKQLTVPTFNVFHANDFVRDVLYPEKSPTERAQRLSEYEAQHGAAARDGIVVQLFDDLDTQVADEEGRLNTPLDPKYDARNVLVQLFGYWEFVLPKDRPYVDSWEETERARFIESLCGVTSQTILKEVYRVFSSIEDDDYLALACIKVLQGTGFDDALIAYCKRRVGKSKDEDAELRAALTALTASKTIDTERDGAGESATHSAPKSEAGDKHQPAAEETR